jgi:hypothetical protein
MMLFMYLNLYVPKVFYCGTLNPFHLVVSYTCVPLQTSGLAGYNLLCGQLIDQIESSCYCMMKQFSKCLDAVCHRGLVVIVVVVVVVLTNKRAASSLLMQ